MAMKQKTLRVLWAACLLATTAHSAAMARPVVLELFTSQGCSSCPPADALLVELARDPNVLALSFHVDYWDRLGWTDAFSLADATQRQYQYSKWLGRSNVFTPQLMVDGTYSVNGADRSAVARAIKQSATQGSDSPITATRGENGGAVFRVGAAPAGANATLIAVRYQPLATTHVARGENGGRSLTSVNNVTAISQLGTWQTSPRDYTVPHAAGEAVALLLQNDADGKILGAASLATK